MTTTDLRMTAEPRQRVAKRERGDVDFQQEMRQKLDEQATEMRQRFDRQGEAIQAMALDVQNVRAHQTPRADIETMVGTRVALETFLAHKAEVSGRLDKLEKAPADGAATKRANLGLLISLISVVVLSLCSGTGLLISGADLLIYLIPHIH